MTAILPLSLELSRLRIALLGTGAACLRRFSWLADAGAVSLVVYSAAPSPELARAAGARLRRHWPKPRSLSRTQLVFIADVPERERERLVRAARRAGAILHVEDAPHLSDAQAPAVLRRGDLTLAISTCGSAPGLAAELKAYLGAIFGPDWRRRVDEISALRHSGRAAGADHQAVRRMIATRVAQAGWLEPLAGQAANDSGRTSKPRGGRSCL